MLEKYEMTPAQLMLNWVTYPESVITIPKAGKVSHVEENARAVDIRISRADYHALSRIFE